MTANNKVMIGVVWLIILIVAVIVWATNHSSPVATTQTAPANQNVNTSSAPVDPAASVALKSKCADDGKTFIANFEETMSRGAGNKPIWFDPQFHFSSRLNTCLAYIQFNTVLSNSAGYDPSWATSGNWNETVENNNIVFDVYSNQAILQSDINRAYTYVNGQKSEKDTLSNYPYSQTIPNSSGDEFLSGLRDLMNS